MSTAGPAARDADRDDARADGGHPGGDVALAREFESHRRLLFTLAYEILSSAADADDVVQETWLRRAAMREPVEHERALLCRIATRLASNARRSAARRREEYVGPWLPEPISTVRSAEDDAVLADAVSHATLVVLETLSPDERVVFVLVEVFAFPVREVGAILERTDASVRQLLHRARERVRACRPHPRASADAETWSRLADAIRRGDADATARLLTDDAVLVTDGGGLVKAALRPIVGPERIARFLVGIATNAPSAAVEVLELNGELSLTATLDGEPILAAFLEQDGARIRSIRIVRNPRKLAGIRTARPVTRQPVTRE